MRSKEGTSKAAGLHVLIRASTANLRSETPVLVVAMDYSKRLVQVGLGKLKEWQENPYSRKPHTGMTYQSDRQAKPSWCSNTYFYTSVLRLNPCRAHRLCTHARVFAIRTWPRRYIKKPAQGELKLNGSGGQCDSRMMVSQAVPYTYS